MIIVVKIQITIIPHKNHQDNTNNSNNNNNTMTITNNDSSGNNNKKYTYVCMYACMHACMHAYIHTYTVSVGIFHKCPVHTANLSENNSKSVLYGWPKSIKIRHQGAVNEITLICMVSWVFAGL